MGNCHPLVQSIFLLCHPCHKKKIFIAEQYILYYFVIISLCTRLWFHQLYRPEFELLDQSRKHEKLTKEIDVHFICKWLEKFTIAFSSSKLKASKRMFNISTYTISVCFIWYMNAHIRMGHKTLLAGTLSIKAFLSMLSACALYVVCTRLTQRRVS